MEVQSTIDNLIKEYQLAIAASKSNPYGNIMDEATKKYNSKAHNHAEVTRFHLDLKLAKLTQLIKERVKFLLVDEQDGNKLYLIYNPFNEDVEKMDKAKVFFTTISTDDSKKGATMYKKISDGIISWSVRVLCSDIEDFFMEKLGKDWINNFSYKTKTEDFCKVAAQIIRYYPHEECRTYSIYLEKFMLWMEKIEECEITIGNILNGILDKLQNVLFKDEREKCKEEGKLDERILAKSTLLSIQDCSKKCHDLFSKIDLASDDATKSLMAMRQRAANAIVQRQMKMHNLNSAKKNPPQDKKRKLPETETEDENGDKNGGNETGEPPKKKAKVDDKVQSKLPSPLPSPSKDKDEDMDKDDKSD